MKKPVLYLAGSVNGHDFETANDWREHATERLKSIYKVLNPLRGRMYGDQNSDDVPEVIEDLIRTEVGQLLDVKLFTQMKLKEQQARELLRKVANDWDDIIKKYA